MPLKEDFHGMPAGVMRHRQLAYIYIQLTRVCSGSKQIDLLAVIQVSLDLRLEQGARPSLRLALQKDVRIGKRGQ